MSHRQKQLQHISEEKTVKITVKTLNHLLKKRTKTVILACSIISIICIISIGLFAYTAYNSAIKNNNADVINKTEDVLSSGSLAMKDTSTGRLYALPINNAADSLEKGKEYTVSGTVLNEDGSMSYTISKTFKYNGEKFVWAPITETNKTDASKEDK